MGLSVNRSTSLLATRQHIWEFQNTEQVAKAQDHYDSTIYQLKTVTQPGYLETPMPRLCQRRLHYC
ncbi:MAG: hypothetical protein M2R45_00751 [Verrucomicrobia subdivision 3 bacterium]|nr:hypothetical protein [Limisphaerales bacterium]MCS1413142.1 hypothetical protein [Limisphaerales bacterium]